MGVWFHQFLRASARLLALVLVFMLVLSVPGYAAVATVQDAERMEDLDPDLYDSGSGGSLFLPDYNAVNQIPYAVPRASYSSVTNTVSNRQNIYVVGIDSSFHWATTMIHLNQSGHFSFVDSSVHVRAFRFHFDKTVLPPAGKYKLSIAFSSDLTPSNGAVMSSFNIHARVDTSNASSVEKVLNVPSSSFTYDGAGGFVVKDVYVDLSNISYLLLLTHWNKDIPAEFGGTLKVEWEPVNSIPSGSDSVSSPLDYSSEDTQQSIANSVSQIPGALYQTSGYIQQVNSTLLEVINTISMQLNALWNQMFNYMHVPMLAQVKDSTQQIVDAINDIYIDFSEFNKEIISNDNRLHQEQLANDDRLHQEQLANDNQNTDTMVNGYDNSGMESSNSKLSQSMQEYESQEARLLGSVQGHIDGFTYVNPFVQFTAPLADVSFMLTGIYTGLGALNIPIAFSLTLSIGLICIGWYRFKGG